MAGIVKLEDGSELYASSLGLSGALDAIGQRAQEINPRLGRWLRDVAKRTAPFMDFDLRELPDGDRATFWLGVEEANRRFADWNQQAAYSGAVEVIRDFYARRGVQARKLEFQSQTIDLDEIWDDEEA